MAGARPGSKLAQLCHSGAAARASGPCSTWRPSEWAAGGTETAAAAAREDTRTPPTGLMRPCHFNKVTRTHPFSAGTTCSMYVIGGTQTALALLEDTTRPCTRQLPIPVPPCHSTYDPAQPVPTLFSPTWLPVRAEAECLTALQCQTAALCWNGMVSRAQHKRTHSIPILYPIPNPNTPYPYPYNTRDGQKGTARSYHARMCSSSVTSTHPSCPRP
jgi:hypothetical protein